MSMKKRQESAFKMFKKGISKGVAETLAYFFDHLDENLEKHDNEIAVFHGIEQALGEVLMFAMAMRLELFEERKIISEDIDTVMLRLTEYLGEIKSSRV